MRKRLAPTLALTAITAVSLAALSPTLASAATSPLGSPSCVAPSRAFVSHTLTATSATVTTTRPICDPGLDVHLVTYTFDGPGLWPQTLKQDHHAVLVGDLLTITVTVDPVCGQVDLLRGAGQPKLTAKNQDQAQLLKHWSDSPTPPYLVDNPASCTATPPPTSPPVTTPPATVPPTTAPPVVTPPAIVPVTPAVTSAPPVADQLPLTGSRETGIALAATAVLLLGALLLFLGRPAARP